MNPDRQLSGFFYKYTYMLTSFKDYFDQQVQHRHRHPVIRDPSTRKNSYTVPRYIRPTSSKLKIYQDFKKQVNKKQTSIGSEDVKELKGKFNVRNMPVNKVKGLKRTGVGMVKRPNGRVQLVKTK